MLRRRIPDTLPFKRTYEPEHVLEARLGDARHVPESTLD
jgi:hypothetical protein